MSSRADRAAARAAKAAAKASRDAEDAEEEDDDDDEEAKAGAAGNDKVTTEAFNSPTAFLAYATTERASGWVDADADDASEALDMANAAYNAFVRMEKQFSDKNATMLRDRLKEARLQLTTRLLEVSTASTEALRTELQAAEKTLLPFLDQNFVINIIRNPLYSSTSRTSTTRSVSEDRANVKFLFPVSVSLWTNFEADVGVDEIEATCGNKKMTTGDWRVLRSFDCGMSEASALSRMSEAVLTGVERYFEGNCPDEGITIDREEGDWLGMRVGVSWTRARRRDDLKKMGLLSTNSGSNKANPTIGFLVHEHKAPYVFPFQPDDDFERRARAGTRVRRTSQRSQSSQASQSSGPSEAPENPRFSAQPRLDLLWARYMDSTLKASVIMFVAPILQTFTCMVQSGLKYAVLSTTDKTWFFRRDERGDLLVSNAYSATAGFGRVKTRRAYFALVNAALRDPQATGMGLTTGPGTLYEAMQNSGSGSTASFADVLAGGDLNGNWQEIAQGVSDSFAKFVKAFFKGQGQGQGDSVHAAREALQHLREVLPLAEDDFCIPRPMDCVSLGHSERTIVDRCNSAGLEMIFKRWVYDIAPRDPTKNDAAQAAMENERRMYTGPLREAQGFAVPFLIYAGSWATLPYVLAVTDEGESLQSLLSSAEDWSEQVRILDTNFESARAALLTIHRLGVVHGDMAERNIVIHPERGAKIIDLENARESTDPDDFWREMVTLYSIFNRSETGAALTSARQRQARSDSPRGAAASCGSSVSAAQGAGSEIRPSRSPRAGSTEKGFSSRRSDSQCRRKDKKGEGVVEGPFESSQ